MTTVTRPVIADVEVVPVAFHDRPLLNVAGVHGPFVLRTIVIVTLTDGTVGLGETYGDAKHIERCQIAAVSVRGADPCNQAEVRARVSTALRNDSGEGGHGMSGMVTGSSTLDRVYSPFEVACLDAEGKMLGLPVAELLGGRVRDRVPFSGYLFSKWAAFPGEAADEWGEALTPSGIVAQARRMVDGWGFTSLKLKGGVLPPDQEVEAILQLRQQFPGMPLRLDPNGAWTEATSLEVIERLRDDLEYIEDPTVGIDGLSAVAAKSPLPIATNMYVVAFDHVPSAVAAGAVQVVLSDHHFWGGLRRTQELSAICRTFGIGLSMHSNSHLGISLAAMVHVAAATEHLTYACDTHWPWKRSDEDVVDAASVMPIIDGAIAVPDAPGLGVELDASGLEELHQLYLACGYTDRDDTGYMRTVQPDFDPSIPRW